MQAAKFLAFALLASGCATAGNGGTDLPADAPKPVDSSQVTSDAPRFDAPIDAPIDAMPDAGPGGDCTTNPECTFPGECCFTIGGPGICVPGDVLLGTCFPA